MCPRQNHRCHAWGFEATPLMREFRVRRKRVAQLCTPRDLLCLDREGMDSLGLPVEVGTVPDARLEVFRLSLAYDVPIGLAAIARARDCHGTRSARVKLLSGSVRVHELHEHDSRCCHMWRRYWSSRSMTTSCGKSVHRPVRRAFRESRCPNPSGRRGGYRRLSASARRIEPSSFQRSTRRLLQRSKHPAHALRGRSDVYQRADKA